MSHETISEIIKVTLFNRSKRYKYPEDAAEQITKKIIERSAGRNTEEMVNLMCDVVREYEEGL